MQWKRTCSLQRRKWSKIQCPVDGMSVVRIWIMEDNSADAFLIELALRRTGLAFEKTVITDGESAIRHIRNCQSGMTPIPQVMLIDLNLPRYDGADILRVLRETEQFDAVGIAVLSSMPPGSTGDGFRVKRHLRKPANLEDFLREVSQAVLELAPK
jgi:CheY-like chemotaxis protein